MRIGIVGYGVGGRYFHAPFIDAAEGLELAGVVARSEARRAEVQADYPGVPVYGSLADMLSAGVDAVTITTPPHTRRELVLEAVAAGVHVVADKPFAPDAECARELVHAAGEAGVVLNVYHNRRRDADILTLADVLSSGALGEPWRVHSIMDQDGADTLEVGPTGGLLRDLGSHLVDQMLWLLGPASRVHATLDWTDKFGEETDCGFFITLTHASGVVSTVSASKLNHSTTRELRAYGSAGSYVAAGADVQADALFAGRRPAAEPETWGIDVPGNEGTLAVGGHRTRVASAQGNYATFYTEFARAVRGEGPEPVPAEEGVRTIEVLDAARRSAREGIVVQL
ncbi:Gfo/Idh/MocA family oxidoreductase [Arthrobacter sp. AK01]|uniref:Gfo/Idh/MocA family protein n=1 Tax=Micrococcaceae TaxID=1268 RepID=UPI001E37646A|nr:MULTISPECIES: Gfo/Idh/MocA family oxidoreductase [Micrococcaceae]MCD4852737.1 Gfo/Idh/MocA family oxidoreductase [Arthrobacter sp. AK01]MCP1412750.1 putative dehydrogenase [Paenarthrobacter sp. A20]